MAKKNKNIDICLHTIYYKAWNSSYGTEKIINSYQKTSNIPINEVKDALNIV